MRSECGARARFRKPLPGGSGPLLGRHDDRSPRSSVDSRQATTGNARQAGSQETRELELSQRRMRSPWRVPRRSAERRAARDRAAAAQQIRCASSRTNCLQCADMAGAPIGAPPPFRGGKLSCASWFAKPGCLGIARIIFVVVIARSEATKQSRTSPRTRLLRFARNDEGDNLLRFAESVFVGVG
jgi:hypothetical protein